MVHFYHDGETDKNALESIALEQLLGWRALVALMENQWQATFANMAFDISAIDEGFAEHRLYAKAKFESIAERLKAITDKGGVLVKCASCSFAPPSVTRTQTTFSRAGAMSATATVGGW